MHSVLRVHFPGSVHIRSGGCSSLSCHLTDRRTGELTYLWIDTVLFCSSVTSCSWGCTPCFLFSANTCCVCWMILRDTASHINKLTYQTTFSSWINICLQLWAPGSLCVFSNAWRPPKLRRTIQASVVDTQNNNFSFLFTGFFYLSFFVFAAFLLPALLETLPWNFCTKKKFSHCFWSCV